MQTGIHEPHFLPALIVVNLTTFFAPYSSTVDCNGSVARGHVLSYYCSEEQWRIPFVVMRMK
jgi:hypothetical protein